MFKLHEIREIIKLIDQTSIKEFELESDGSKLSIKKSGGVEVPQPVYIHSEPAVAPTVVNQATVPPIETSVTPNTEVTALKADAKQEDEMQNLHKVVSPMVGTFYRAAEPGAAPFIASGDRVNPNSVVCIVEAMKLFNEITADVSGEIVKVLVEDGSLVEYGQPLFLVKAQ
ncbi:acetyl-CoA carboxylase biotin carboxyl carrier protein [Brevibacillus daliensis]|uniref:acetyl-CoA carboxylase biotin carboxyl carrier protein n=1 Tax=Brevibacillus daliensis TaxID=2892995 RepID=UPI001E4E4A71|nr:acetyl-CoA carboxylase biotin carboxyl carrier protein [Brevibacillus daliensis]